MIWYTMSAESSNTMTPPEPSIDPRSDRLARHVLREVEQQVQVGRLALPRQNALEDLGGPGGAFTALRALGARLVGVEAGQPHDLVHHVRRVVEHDDAARAEHRPPLDDAFVVEQAALGLRPVEDRHRRAAGNAGLERAAGPHAA